MIVVTGTLRCRPEERALVEAFLPEHVRLSRAEPGCLLFQVVANRCDPGEYLVAERFIDRAAFEAHQRRAAGSDWGRATAGLSRAFQVAELPDTGG